jgi:AcrR family transcriptional regulator
VQNYLYGGGMSESADTGLRERKKLDTRRALSDAALQLAFDRGGLDAVTREEIAALAGVSLRTFNNYFTGKYEALAYRMAERMQRSLAVFRSRPADEPLWTSIIEAMTGTLEEEMVDITGADLIPDRRELIEVRKLLMRTEVRNAVPQILYQDWVAAIAERTGLGPDDMYPRLVVAVVRAIGDTAMEAYANADPPVSITQLMRAGFDAVIAGLPEPTRTKD